MTSGARDLDARVAANRIAVLGPVAVGTPEVLQPLGGRPARVLLALAAADRPSSLELLAELVWGDDRPATHRAALHVHLGSVRRLLGELGGGARIARSEAGYGLDPGENEIDAVLAEDLLTDARRLLDEEPAAALHRAEQALALWRGVPFAVDGEVVDVAASQHLEGVRRDGEELLIEVLLRLGDAGRAETEAARAVAAEPLRENRWGQLLRARYLGGRTADALATYQEARRVLVEALGIEPGRDLQDLEAATLTHDAVRLRLPVQGTEREWRLPPTTGAFVGRDRELRRIGETLATTGCMTILGPPGVGKSRLARELGRVSGDAVAHIDLRDPTTTSGGTWLREVIDWVRRHPAGLVVLDNGDGARSEVAEAMRELTRRAPTVRIVVTSRAPLAIDMAVEVLQAFELPDVGVTDDEVEAAPAVQAFRAFLHELAPDASVRSQDVAALTRRAGGLPLTLRLLAATARALPPSAMIDLPPSAAGDEIDRATLAILGLVDDVARSAFGDLSIVAGAFDAELGADVAGIPREQFMPVLVQLIDHGLVQARPDRPRPYAMLEPIRAVAGRLLDQAGDRDAACDRHADACIALAAALEHMSADAEVTSLEDRFVADMPHFRQAIDHLARSRDAERALRLVCWLELPLYASGWWAEKVELFDQALAIRGPISPMRSRAHAFRARPGPMHMFDVAHAERAERIATELGEETLRAFARFVRLVNLWWLGRHSEAAEIALEVSTVFDRAGRRYEACEARKFLGVALVFDGQADAGLEMQRDVLAAVRRDVATPFAIAHNLAYLGHCHRLLGDDTAAFADWTEARELSTRIRNRGTAIHINIGLAEIAADRGQHEAALEQAGEALDLIGASRAWTYEPWAWTVAMRAHLAAHDLRSASACARRAAGGLSRVPSGETVRLAMELASVAVAAEDGAAAGRLLGVAAAVEDRRELPFPAPAERARWTAVERAVSDSLGSTFAQHVEAGRRCTLAEAAGSLLVT